jgi:MoaA/NifB/PqqE/SkfB family radical SAM enzyme
MANNNLSVRGAWEAGSAVLKTICYRKRTPLMIGWNLTFRCNLRCSYCGVDQLDYEELATEQVCKTLDELYAIGGRWITFSGGEPLLRRDLPEIIDHAHNLGMHVFMSSNGRFIPRDIEKIKNLDKVSISIDGPEDVHDDIRGKGSLQHAVDGIRVCQENDILVSLTCVLSRDNLDRVEEVLDFADEHNVWIIFQPATKWLEATDGVPNPLAPPEEEYRQTIRNLMALKKKGAPISNSQAGMRHLLNWPNKSPVGCKAGVLTCTIEPDGRMIACDFDPSAFHGDNAQDAETATERFKAMRVPEQCCQECWCAPLVELNLVFSFNLSAIFNIIQMEMRPAANNTVWRESTETT